MKKKSSLKTRMCELFPLVVSRMTTPVHSPCRRQAQQAKADIIMSIVGIRRGRETAGAAAASMSMRAYDDERGDGLVDPAVLLQEVAEDDAGAEQRDEEVDGHHRRVVGGGAQHAQPHQLRHHAEPHAARPPPIRQAGRGGRKKNPIPLAPPARGRGEEAKFSRARPALTYSKGMANFGRPNNPGKVPRPEIDDAGRDRRI